MRRTLQALSVLALLCLSTLSQAMTGIFWQPQLRDNNVSDTQWVSLMKSLQQQGFDTLIVQWTQYGEALSGQEEQTILKKRMSAAHDAGLHLVIGLNSDPEFFSLQKQSASVLPSYLTRLKDKDIKQAQYWSEALAGKFEGWYISAEIDDANWRDDSVRTMMKDWLKDTHSSLVKVANKPIYISSFFAGNTTPSNYAKLIAEINGIGLNVWVQDGGGTNTLTTAQRTLYLDASAGCSTDTPASGVIYELFSIHPSKTFKASQKETKDITRLLTTPSQCEKDRIFFSLRYLPIANGIMENS